MPRHGCEHRLLFLLKQRGKSQRAYRGWGTCDGLITLLRGDRMARSKGSSKYGAEIVERICAEIAVGKSMREICRAADMPDMRTVFRWLAAHK